jgi:hypothetical protein
MLYLLLLIAWILSLLLQNQANHASDSSELNMNIMFHHIIQSGMDGIAWPGIWHRISPLPPDMKNLGGEQVGKKYEM